MSGRSRGRGFRSLQSLIDERNGITKPHRTVEQQRQAAEAMRRVAASLPQPRQSSENAPDSKEGQAVSSDLALTMTTTWDGRNGCTSHGTE